jgi:CBS domain-containing protein
MGHPPPQGDVPTPYTVPPGEGPHIAARIMRNHRLHHVLVVQDHKVVGMLSTFDLLRLVEDHRYQAKQAPTPPKKQTGPADP